jgi:LPXTG-motif cell wall-anchored protein
MDIISIEIDPIVLILAAVGLLLTISIITYRRRKEK